MRRFLRPISALICLSGLLLGLGLAPAALAQSPSPEGAAARLTLLRQTPFASSKQPVIEFAVRAENVGKTPLADLSVSVTILSPVRTREGYAQSLVSDPPGAVGLVSRTTPLDGTLAPGEERDVRLTVGLADLVGTIQSLVYPMRVELESAGLTVATLRTPVIFLVRDPKVPLDLSWTFVLHQPILFGPDGRFRSAALERSVAPGGRLAAEVGALRAMTGGRDAAPVDVVVSPTLLLQLERMRDGYAVVEEDGGVSQVPAGEGGAAAAGGVLDALSAVTGADGTETVAFPFAAPSLPALLAGGLSKDLPTQFERGDEEVQRVTGATPSATVFRAPGSSLDTRTLEALSARGVTILLLNPDQTPPVEVLLDFAPPATASLRAGDGTMGAITPDPSVQAMLASELPSQDPALAAQAILGELAAIWLESPTDPSGVALIVTPEMGLPSAFYGPFIRGISRAPWLDPVSASELTTLYPPPEEPTRLLGEATSAFSPRYVEEVKQARRHVAIYLSMLPDPSAAPPALNPARVATLLLLAESGQFVGNEEEGLAFVRSIQDAVNGELGKIQLDEGQQFTLTSRSRPIPIRIRNETDGPIRVRLSLASGNRLRLGDGGTKIVTLAPGDNVVSFDVHLVSAGVFEVTVLIESPSGGKVTDGTLTVRSTAFNRVALWITLAAGVAFLVLWGRRLLPRHRSS